MNRTLIAVLLCGLLLTLAACGQKSAPPVSPTVGETPSGAVTDADIDASAAALDKAATDSSADTSSLDSLDSDIAAINSADI